MTGGRLQEGHPEDFQKARRNRINPCHKKYLKTKRRLSPHLQGPDDAETNASVHSAVDENIHNLAWGSEKVKKGKAPGECPIKQRRRPSAIRLFAKGSAACL